MAVTLYLRVLEHERPEWERKGWEFVRNLWLPGNRKQCLVRKTLTK